jgi:hypothetical protein
MTNILRLTIVSLLVHDDTLKQAGVGTAEKGRNCQRPNPEDEQRGPTDEQEARRIVANIPKLPDLNAASSRAASAPLSSKTRWRPD